MRGESIRLFWAFCLGLLLSFACAQGADLYVSTQGRDSNEGTADKPFRTITHAYRHAKPGVTIHVSPGVYDDYSSRWGLHLRKDGKPGEPIVLRSTARGGAVIDGRNAWDRNQGFYVEACYNVIDGFQIRNCPLGGIAMYGDHNRIINNEIHHNGNPASSSTNGKDGIYSERDTKDNVYEGNCIHDNGRKGSNLDHGLYLCGKNELVFRNVIYRNSGSGLQIAGYTKVCNMKVYNNVIAWNGTSGIILWMELDGVDIKNNIAYHNGHRGLASYRAHGTGVVVDHNLFFDNQEGDYSFTADQSDYSYKMGEVIVADPRFVDGTRECFDAHLSPGSPARGAGLPLPELALSRCDLGAYVSQRAGPAQANANASP